MDQLTLFSVLRPESDYQVVPKFEHVSDNVKQRAIENWSLKADVYAFVCGCCGKLETEVV